MIRIGLIGYGYWGPNLARNFSQVEGIELAMLADLNPSNLDRVRQQYPTLRTTGDATELIRDPNIDAVAVATPVGTHFELALQALREGKHVWVEKPLAATGDEARRLQEEAERQGKQIFVDHTFVYTPAVRKIKELIESGSLGEIYYFDSVRVNLGLIQPDINVLFDLAVHDLSIMQYVLPEAPIAVSATGVAHLRDTPEDITFLTCFFESSLISHVHVNWLAPAKVRRTLIGGDRTMIIYDDLEPSEKVKIYDRGIVLRDASEEYEARVDYRSGNMWSPHLGQKEALGTAAEHFRDCIHSGERPITGAEEGRRLVEILEAANQSLQLRGAPVQLPREGPRSKRVAV